MQEVVLPKFGAHLTYRTRYKFNERDSAPFPDAKTTEEILGIAAYIEKQG